MTKFDGLRLRLRLGLDAMWVFVVWCVVVVIVFEFGGCACRHKMWDVVIMGAASHLLIIHDAYILNHSPAPTPIKLPHFHS